MTQEQQSTELLSWCAEPRSTPAASGKAKRLHRLEQLAEQDDNRNAAVAAIKVAEQIVDDPVKRVGAVASPGIVIRVLNVSAAPAGPSSFVDVRPGVDVDADA